MIPTFAVVAGGSGWYPVFQVHVTPVQIWCMSGARVVPPSRSSLVDGSEAPNRHAAKRHAGKDQRRHPPVPPVRSVFLTGSSMSYRRPSSCHHSIPEEHRCHPGPCPPCRQSCLLPLPGCSHTCPQSCHDEVLVRSQQVGPLTCSCSRLGHGQVLFKDFRWDFVPQWTKFLLLLCLCCYLPPQLNIEAFPVFMVFLGTVSWSMGAAV